MNCIDIDSSQHELYDSWRKLYTVSFPIFEQRTQEQQEKAFSCADYHLVGYSEGDMFVGFISYWEFGSYRYIEHFAVHQGLRGRGYGSEILNAFLRSTSKIVLLGNDPIVDSVSRARLRFYRSAASMRTLLPIRILPIGRVIRLIRCRAYISPVYNRK